MSRFRGQRGRTGPTMLSTMLPMRLPTVLRTVQATILLALLWMAGCVRPDGPPSDEGSTRADQHQVPFEAGDAASSSRPGEFSAAKDAGANPGLAAGTSLPFHDSQNLPAGTLLTVRLKNPISADNPGPNATFDAVVDEPVVIAGNRLIPRGVMVSGRVESAGASNVRNNRGYVRLALDSIQFTGASLPIQTSSLFVRGNADDPVSQGGAHPSAVAPGESPAAIRLEKGRRLTFRLTEPAYVAVSRTQTGH